MSIITRTIYGAKLQTELLMGLPHTPVPNSTLNEHFDVFPGVYPNNGETPVLRYMGIGVGGHRQMTGSENQPYNDPVEHDPADGSLYRPVPFVLREINDDLSPVERQRYAMRRQETINGVNYIAYYLRRLNMSGVQPIMTLNVPQVSTGSSRPAIVTTEFVPTGANLNPTPPNIPVGSVITTDGSYLAANATLTVGFSEADTEELLNVARIKWNNERLMVISEMQLVAGVDRPMTSTIGGGSINYIEAVCALPIAYLSTELSMANLTKGVNHSLELGTVEPLRIISVP